MPSDHHNLRQLLSSRGNARLDVPRASATPLEVGSISKAPEAGDFSCLTHQDTAPKSAIMNISSNEMFPSLPLTTPRHTHMAPPAQLIWQAHHEPAINAHPALQPPPQRIHRTRGKAKKCASPTCEIWDEHREGPYRRDDKDLPLIVKKFEHQVHEERLNGFGELGGEALWKNEFLGTCVWALISCFVLIAAL